MQPHSTDARQLQAEIDELRARLSEAERSLHAMRGDTESAAPGADQPAAASTTPEHFDNAYRAHILDNMSDAVIATDEQFAVVYWNRAAEAIYGWRADETIGKRLSDVLRTVHKRGGDDQSEYLELLHARQWRGEVTQFHKDGRPIEIESSVGLLRDTSGRVTGLIGVNRDVTERKAAEEERQRLLAVLQEQRIQAENLTAEVSHERDLLQTIMDNAGTMLVYMDREFIIRMVNTTYVASSGHTQQELLGQNHFKLFPNAENEVIFAKVRDTGKEIVFHARAFEYADQPERGVTYWDWTLVALCDSNGRTEGLVLSLLDVTESVHVTKEREKLLHDVADQRTLLESIVQQLPSGVIIAEAQTNKIIMANEQIAHLWGHPFISIGHIGEFTDQYPTYYDDGRLYPLAQRPLVRSLRQGEQISGEIMRFPRADGTWGHIEARSAPIRDSNGNIIAGAVVLTDVTERLQRIEQLANQAQLIETIHEAVMVVDPQLRVTFWNRGAEELYGWTAEEAVGRNARELARTELTEAQQLELARIPALGQPFRGEYIQHHKDGRRIHVDVSSVGLRDSAGNITGILSANRDMTAQREAADALRQSEERFRVALRNSPISVYNQDRDLRYIWIYNPSGFTAEEAIGKTDAAVMAPETAAEMMAIKRKVLQSGIGERSEICDVVDKEFRVFDLTVEPLRDAVGAIVGVTCAAADVTERYNVTSELRRWGHIFEYARLGRGHRQQRWPYHRDAQPCLCCDARLLER